ncbi:DndE family protein [Halomonas sp. ML-15]|uniref:DndE family protein n=1 Tax=unclassified Halomonas TaxID=2609666 RepID=UPI0003ED7303|nr:MULTISPECIES: DndE family protein [unclassified Halomonas]EWH04023.1 hypothetical protein Q427_00060 [Halomonas sp. BC04]MBD3895471.1 DndE family protein [Halomonas sp. ML-15]
MLPSRFSLTKSMEEKLKREKQRTGVPPNILARELFFRSIEQGPITETTQEFISGHMMLEKSTWLGELEEVTEAVLINLYGKQEKSEAAKKWALHVERAVM